MRQRRSKRLALALAGTLLSATALSRQAFAQSPTATEGAVFLLLPVGARASALGEAVTASRQASEALWWNPAGIGTATSKEVSIHHSQSFVGTGDAVSIIIPSSLLGVLGIEFNLIDFGDQDIVDRDNNPLGTLLPRSVVLGATYGTNVVAGLSTGIGFKLVQLRVDCSGSCQSLPTFSGTSYAVDVGLQYDMGEHAPLSLGFAVRNLGIPFQVNDGPQSDPLPRRVQIGAEYRYVPPSTMADSIEIRASLDVIGGIETDERQHFIRSPRPRAGAELSWRRKAFARVGYVVRANQQESGGPSIGFGYASGSVAVDIARILTGFSADAGQAPTYLSLRVKF